MLNGKMPLLAAVSLALVAGLLAHLSFSAQKREVLDDWEPLPILVAAASVNEGDRIVYAEIERSSLPARFVSPSMVPPEHADTIVGQRLLVPLRPGDPILWSHFEGRQEGDRLSSMVMKRARAVTVAVNERSSVGGWIRPNDHVDVLSSFIDPETQQMVTVTLLRNVIVLATGDRRGEGEGSSRQRNGYNDVSLLVLPEEAEILVLAQELGNLTLVLRHPEETDVEDERSRTTIGTLMTGERSKALQRLRSQTIQVIRGRGSAHDPASR